MTTTDAPLARRGPLARVRAETFPDSLSWRPRDWVALCAVPAVFAAAWATSLFSHDPATRAVSDTATRIVLFIVLAVANRELLARHWRAFIAAPWFSAFLVLAGVIVIQIVIDGLHIALRPFAPHGPSDAGDDLPQPGFGVMLFVSFAPVVTALIEDFVFRHTLLMKLLVRTRFLLVAPITLGNALLFGAIHLENFGGHLVLTLAFAGAGLLMNLVYLWTRNIWHVLLMHGVNNFVLAGPLTVAIVHALTPGN